MRKLTAHNYDFVLTFRLPRPGDEPEQYLDALFEARCDDALVGAGRRGLIALHFARTARSAEDAITTAIHSVRTAIPGCDLIQVGPDLVGLTEMAEIFGFSRQNMRKYAVEPSSMRQPFPVPAIIGEPSLWHLSEVLVWLRENTEIKTQRELLELSKLAAKINLERESARLRSILELS